MCISIYSDYTANHVYINFVNQETEKQHTNCLTICVQAVSLVSQCERCVCDVIHFSFQLCFPWQALVLLLSASDVMVLHCSLYALIGLAQRYASSYVRMLDFIHFFFL